jgi:hypothetical protein
MRSTLFRQEAIDSLRDRHLGDALTARPLALSLLTALSVLVALVLSFGLIANTHARRMSRAISRRRMG